MPEKTQKFYFQMILIVALMVGIGMLPPFGQITDYGMRVLGIFVGCVVGWGFGHNYFASILALLLLAFCGENTFDGVFSGAFGHQSILMVLFSLLFCFGIEQTGIMHYIANWILSRKFATKGPWFISLAFWIACSVCSALITNTLPVIILLWTMFYAIVNETQVERTNTWVQVTMIMMCVTGYTGSVIMPYAGWNLMVFGIAMSSVPTLSINLFAHTTLMIVLNILIIMTIFLVSKIFWGKKTQNLNVKRIVDDKDLKMTKQQKFGILYLVILALMLFLPNVLSADVPGIAILSKLTATGSFAVVTLLLCITHVDGKPLMEPYTAMKNLPWPLMFLLIAALYIAGLIASAQTGISATILAMLNSSVGRLGVIGIMAVFVGVGCLVTNAINNVVCVNIFVPIGAGMVASIGGDANVLASLLCPILYLGLALPSGSVVGGLMHGNVEWLQTKSIYKYATIGCCIVVFWCVLVGIPLGNFLF